MLIDWFTVGAQTLNFLILVWLMKRFLYTPVLSAIDEREKRIATELANADKKKKEAQKESDDFKHKNELFDQQRATLLSKATDEATAERQRLLDEARQAADALRAKRQETLKNDARTLNQEIRLRTEQEVFAIARKALTDLAGTGLEESMVDLFVNRLRTLQGVKKEQLTSAIKASRTPVIVRTASDLAPALTASTERAITEIFGAGIQVRFETAPEMISGIELATDGHKVAWSIADYLTSMENGVNELLSERGEPKPKPKPKPKSKPKPKPKPRPKPKPKLAVKPKRKPKPKPESKHETKSQ